MNQVYSLFSHRPDNDERKKDIVSKRKPATNVFFASFSAKRNAARIDKYFIASSSFRFKVINILITNIVILASILSALVLINDNFVTTIIEKSIPLIKVVNYRIANTIRTVFEEPMVFTEIFNSLFSMDGFLELSSKNSVNITRLLTKAHISGSGYTIWWDIGLDSGELVSIESHNPYTEQVYLLYANMSDSNSMSVLKSWVSNSNGINSSYPIIGGDIVGPFSTKDRIWYQKAIEKNSSSWTDIHYGKSIDKKVMMFSRASPIFNNSIISAVTSQSIGLEYIQTILESQVPSNKSKLAIVLRNNTVIAITGNDKPYIQMNGSVIMRDLSDMEDPTWYCLSQNSNNFNYDGFYIKCGEKDTMYTYFVQTQPISVAEGIEMNLTSVLSVEDFSGEMNNTFRVNFIVSLVGIAMIWVSIYMFNLFLRSYQETYKYSLPLLSSNGFKFIGASSAINILTQLSHNKKHGKEISKELKDIVKQLKTETPFYYSRPVFSLGDINEKESMAFIDENYHLYRSIKYSCLKLIPLSYERKRRSTIKKPKITRSPEPINRQDFSSSTEQFKLEYIISTFLSINDYHSYVDPNSLRFILSKFLSEYSSLFLVADSIDLINVIFNNHLYTSMIDENISFCMIIATLSTFLARAKQYESNQVPWSRFFLNSEDEAIHIALYLLKQIISVKKCESQDTWKEITDVTIQLIRGSLYCQLIPVLTQSRLIIESVKSTRNMSTFEHAVIMKLIFNLSQISYFFLPYEQRIVFSSILHSDFDTKKNEIIEIEESLYKRVFEKAVFLLKSILNTDIFTTYRK